MNDKIDFYAALAEGHISEAYFHLGAMDKMIGDDATYLVPPDYRIAYFGGHLVTILLSGSWA
jgi:hypothetical protein